MTTDGAGARERPDWGMSKTDNDRSPALESLKFAGAVLVCGECEERSDGPKKLAARDVRKALKHNLGEARFKLRVVQSSCLGLCPKKAIALAALGPGTHPLGAAVCDAQEAAAFAGTVVRALR